MSLKGSCACGTVTYEIEGPFNVMGNCHCSICRKTHGAAFVTWGLLGPGQFRWLSGEALLGKLRSSPGRERLFCRQCGTPLASSHDDAVGEVAIGTLDGDPGQRPAEHIFVGSKAPWHDITDRLPQHPTWPPGMAGEPG